MNHNETLPQQATGGFGIDEDLVGEKIAKWMDMQNRTRVREHGLDSQSQLQSLKSEQLKLREVLDQLKSCQLDDERS